MVKTPSRRVNDLFYVILFFLFLILLIGFILAGTQSRYLADDYCYDAQFIKQGFWQGQVDSYLNLMPYSSNRYGLTLFSGLFWLLGGVRVMPFLPGFFIVLWGFVLVYVIYQGQKLIRFHLPVPAIFFAAASILFYTILLAPNRYQILFWRSGLLPYLAPLVFNTWLLGRFFYYKSKNKISWWGAAELGFTSWLAAGFSETVFALQMAFWGMLLLWSVWRRQVIARTSVIFILLGSLLGASLLLFNPTNAIRQSFFPQPPALWVVAFTSIRYALDFFFDYLHSAWLPLFIYFCSGALVGWLEWTGNPIRWRQLGWSFVGLMFGLLVLLTSLMAPTMWSMSAYPEQRGLLAGAYLINLFLFGLGLGIGVAAAKIVKQYLPQFLRIGISFLLVIGLSAYALHFISTIYDLVPVYQIRAETWDLRHAEILQKREDGQKHILIPGIDSIAGIFELQPEEGHWVNRCAAEYYGIDGIKTTE